MGYYQSMIYIQRLVLRRYESEVSRAFKDLLRSLRIKGSVKCFVSVLPK